MRRVHVNVTVRLILDMEEGKEVSETIQEMDYNFQSNTKGVEILDTEIVEHEVKDSR